MTSLGVIMDISCALFGVSVCVCVCVCVRIITAPPTPFITILCASDAFRNIVSHHLCPRAWTHYYRPHFTDKEIEAQRG